MQAKEVSKRISEIGIVPCARVKNPDHVLFAAETLCAAVHLMVKEVRAQRNRK